MKKSNSYLPQVAKLCLAALLVVFTLALTISPPLQAADADAAENVAIPCNDQMAIDAAKNNEKVKECVAAAKAMYPNRTVSVSVNTTSGCSTTIRGCTYTVYISLTFPCPSLPCLAGPDILVATVSVNCTFNVTNVDCHV